MPATLELSEVIDRSAADVFRFYAIEHVQNHPRWDPTMKLEKRTIGPIGLGTIIRRENSRSGTPVEGTMQVVEFEPNQTFGMVIHDGPVEIHGRAILQPLTDGQTRLTFHLEFPGMDESTDMSLIAGGIQQSLTNIKTLVEADSRS